MHIIEAITEALSFVGSVSQNEFNSDRKLILSIIKEIEIIGEAVSKLSPEFIHKYPAVPWRDIVGMRNHLIHGYFDT